MPDRRRVQALVEAYAEQRESLVDRVVQSLLALWFPFKWWSHPQMMSAWSGRSALIADAGAREARRLARAYAVEVLRESDALPGALPPISDAYPRSNTRPDSVYERPARHRGWLEHRDDERSFEIEVDDAPEDDDLDEIPDRGPLALDDAFRDRLTTIVEDDLSFAGNDEVQRTYQAAPTVTGYRRIIHPELSRGGTCGLCLVASTRTYSIDDLMPLHDRCKCTVLPITTEFDPGFELSEQDLRDLYNEAGSSYGKDLTKIRVKTVLHGELGPKLVHEDHRFRSPDDVNSEAGRTIAYPWKRKTPADEKRMWEETIAHAQEMNEALAEAILNDSNLIEIGDSGQEIEVADIRQAMEYNRDLIAYARRRTA